MAIDAVTPVFREIAAASAVPQASLTRRDRELQEQVEEGRPPIEVAEAELEALCRRKGEELRERWRKRQEARRDREPLSEDGAGEAAMVEENGEGAEEQSRQLRENAESLEEETGMLFDGRS
jgi:hypothetical protein